jgi:hypothetical protein
MNQYQLRQTIRAAWNEPFNPQYAMILKVTDRFEAVASLRTFATELGARAIILDIDGELSDDQIQLLKRKGPRIVIMVGIETLKPDAAGKLSEMINSGGRAMPVILWIEAAEEIQGSEESDGETAIAA